MKRFVLVLALATAACGNDVDEGEQEMLDTKAVEAVEAANDAAPPVEEVVPDPILAPDIERYDILGQLCSYAPGTSLGARVISREADAFMKIEGEIERFAADPGSRELPMGTRSLYNGKEFSLRLEIEPADGTEGEVGTGPGEYEGHITLRDRWDRVVYSGTGLTQCGDV